MTGTLIVLYYPDIKQVMLNIAKISESSDAIVLVDNTPVNDISYEKEMLRSMKPEITYLSLGGNLGIAAAHNAGADHIFNTLDCRFMLLLDQDSIPDSTLISGLKATYLELQGNHIKTGAVGPDIYNSETNEFYLKKSKHNFFDRVYRVETLISSGSLISKEAFSEIGYFETGLFIDFVDHEWCFRARKMGFSFYVDRNSPLNHSMGQKQEKFLGTSVFIPEPVRTYYTYRNFLILIKRKYIPVNWKIRNGLHFFFKLFYYSLFSGNSKKYRKNIWNGIKDGLNHKGGRQRTTE